MTTTTTEATPHVPQASVPVTLRLRVEPAEERHIQWAEDVIDNEGMGKKSSKGKWTLRYQAAQVQERPRLMRHSVLHLSQTPRRRRIVWLGLVGLFERQRLG